MPEDFTFSSNFTNAMTAMLFVCVMVPAFYYIYYAFRKKIVHVPMLSGIAAFLIFSFFVSGLLLGTFAPQSKVENMGPALHAVVRGLCIGISESAGIYIVLRMLSAKYDTVKTPISFGLGYSLFNLLLIGGANAAIRLSQAIAVNNNGVNAILDTVELAQRDALAEELQSLSDTPISIYLLTVAEHLCFFLICIGITRLLWYSIMGGKRSASWIFIPIAVVLRVAVEIPHAFRAAGGTNDYIFIECIYYIISVVILALSIIASLFWDKRETVKDSPVNRRSL